MARYQIVFRRTDASHVMLVDDFSSDGEQFALFGQTLEIGATVAINGTDWIVAETQFDGIRQFICDPVR